LFRRVPAGHRFLLPLLRLLLLGTHMPDFGGR
jgi:hypothetical protein